MMRFFNAFYLADYQLFYNFVPENRNIKIPSKRLILVRK